MNKRFTAAALLLVLTASAGAVDFSKFKLDKLVDMVPKVLKATTEMAEEEEIQLGSDLSASLLGAMPLVQDAGVQQYVNRVGRWLAMQSERPKLPWHFAVTDTDTVGAFAAPGGYVMVTRGLVLLMTSEQELAGVLAHEIAHVVEKHHVRAVMKAAQREVAVEVARSAMDQQSLLAEQLVKSGMQLYGRGLERGDELDADGRGAVIAARAGYDPSGLLALLLTLEAINPEDENMALLTATHPPVGDRIEALVPILDGELAEWAVAETASARFSTMLEKLAAAGTDQTASLSR
ncbi:MAG: M48 family metalloprotease [Gammaproteobacteria bacterium]|nr:M48 family metalloprotease [Gammaproteobacteria bacterium]NNL99554.1 M48 family metalloprotease [Gammaproteobacteria bacterium]